MGRISPPAPARVAGVDPREMAKSDLIVVWGTNPVSTQVNVMTHVSRARKERGAKLAVVDIYDNDTMKQADIKILLRPGTDGAFACGVMHVLFREGFADRDYLAKYTDCDETDWKRILPPARRNGLPDICGVPVADIEAFARHRRARRNAAISGSATASPAAAMVRRRCMPRCASLTVTGAWQHEGGGAFFNNAAIWKFDKTLIEGLDVLDAGTRRLDQSQDRSHPHRRCCRAEGRSTPIKAMLIQNTNPMTVAHRSRRWCDRASRARICSSRCTSSS